MYVDIILAIILPALRLFTGQRDLFVNYAAGKKPAHAIEFVKVGDTTAIRVRSIEGEIIAARSVSCDFRKFVDYANISHGLPVWLFADDEKPRYRIIAEFVDTETVSIALGWNSDEEVLKPLN